MPWGKMDDKFHRNRKVRELRRSKQGREALGAWTFWWSWCLDDPDLTGVVPADELDERDKKSAATLVQAGLWVQLTDGYAFHDFHDYNPTKAQVSAKREYDKTFVSLKRLGNSSTVVNDSDTSSTRVVNESDTSRVPRAFSQPNPTQPKDNVPEVPSADIASQVASLESRYNLAIIHEAREACALSRKRGTMTDSAWLVFLRKAAAYNVREVEDGCRTFCDKWADGDRSENYLLAIIRGNSKPKHNVPKIGMIAPGRHEDFVTDTSDLDRIIGAK